jgi:hypothetical protein
LDYSRGREGALSAPYLGVDEPSVHPNEACRTCALAKKRPHLGPGDLPAPIGFWSAIQSPSFSLKVCFNRSTDDPALDSFCRKRQVGSAVRGLSAGGGRSMNSLAPVLAVCCVFGATPSLAADICEAVAMHDVPAIGNPDAILKAGEHDTAVTQYRVNKKTGETSFCSHGGSCYPITVVDNGRKVIALRLANCKIGARDPFDDPDQILYNIEPIASKNPPKTLRIDDLDNKFLAMGLCSACASNVADLVVNQPTSRCADLGRRALGGDAEAVKALKEFPDYCQEKK